MTLPPHPVDAFATPAGQAVLTHHASIRDAHLRDLFAADPSRVAAMTVDAVDIVVDLSRHRATPETLNLLVALAESVGLPAARTALLTGEAVNTTENRPALHTALRMPAGSTLVVDGHDVVADVHSELDRMAQLATAVRSGEWVGATGRPVRDVVNLGIGGSHLGPAMACQALAAFSDTELRVHHVSNVDPGDLASLLPSLDPASTLFVVVSKTFGTQETLANADQARSWCIAALGDDAVAHHFIAVSARADRVRAFGIADAHRFDLWDWVGGRFSVMSAVGLSVMLAVGVDHFRAMLAGAHAMDEHFARAPLRSNAPALLGLLSVWYANAFGSGSLAVVPYAQALQRFPAFLQQMVMESNGKSVTRDGAPVANATSPVVWGEPGTNGQHAFFQLLHQGTGLVPVDFIGFANAQPRRDLGSLHAQLLANLLAQPAALAFGRTPDELRAKGVPEPLVAHKAMPGNRPSSVILAPQLTPSVLGQLVALYEHAVFTEGVVWGIDSFDQWGVELGKELADDVGPALSGGRATLDPATRAAVDRLVAWRRDT